MTISNITWNFFQCSKKSNETNYVFMQHATFSRHELMSLWSLRASDAPYGWLYVHSRLYQIRLKGRIERKLVSKG